jgi:hypothetical protein
MGAPRESPFSSAAPVSTGTTPSRISDLNNPTELTDKRAEDTRRLAASLPTLGGIGGGLVGGLTGGPGGLVLGSAIGGAAGKAAGQGMTGTLPSGLMEGVKTIGGAGLLQGALAIPGALTDEAIPFLANSASATSAGITERATAAALARERAVTAAKNIEAPIADQVTVAARLRSDTGAKVGHALKGADALGAPPITPDEIAQRIIERAHTTYGRAMPPEGQAAIRASVAARMNAALPQESLEMIQGAPKPSGILDANGNPLKAPPLKINMQDAGKAKSIFQTLSRSESRARSLGMNPNPDLDREIGSAVKSALEDRIKGLDKLHAESQQAIINHQALLKLSRAQPTKAVAGIKQGAREATATALAGMPDNQEMVTLHGGLPMPSLSIGPRGMKATLDAAAATLRHPLVSGTLRGAAHGIPRLAGLGYDEMQPQGR